MKGKNVFYAQSGGVTAVINASAAGLLDAINSSNHHGKVFVGQNGILGALQERVFDLSKRDPSSLIGLRTTPAGAFGSCRHKLTSDQEYQKLIEFFQRYEIGYFFYNGGGDSQDTSNKVAKLSEKIGYPLTCIGIPKTIDNDLPVTDSSPGFGSAAKYIAISSLEAALDIRSMSPSSTKVFIMEVMGRHVGWLAAAGGVAHYRYHCGPHLILFPEVEFKQEIFLAEVDKSVKKEGYCVIVASEGLKGAGGKLLGESGNKDAFGHSQLAGVAEFLAQQVRANLKYKTHYAVCDYLQRAARHIASKVDVDQAYALGKAAWEFAQTGENAIMTTIIRTSESPFKWKIGSVPLDEVANIEKTLPSHYISSDGFHITNSCREYLEPLINGEDYPTYKDGLPNYLVLNNEE